jgi:hypothetical protein
MLAVRFWTHYWTHETTTFDQALVESGEIPSALDHTAGNSFRKRGVRPGDGVYVVSYHHGSIRLVGRLVVETIVDQRARSVHCRMNRGMRMTTSSPTVAS